MQPTVLAAQRSVHGEALICGAGGGGASCASAAPARSVQAGASTQAWRPMLLSSSSSSQTPRLCSRLSVGHMLVTIRNSPRIALQALSPAGAGSANASLYPPGSGWSAGSSASTCETSGNWHAPGWSPSSPVRANHCAPSASVRSPPNGTARPALRRCDPLHAPARAQCTRGSGPATRESACSRPAEAAIARSRNRPARRYVPAAPAGLQASPHSPAGPCAPCPGSPAQ